MKPVDGDDRRQLRALVGLLEKGEKRLRAAESYVATFTKRERVKKTLQDEQTMLLKVRRRPFSIFLKWLDSFEGRRVAYVEGRHDGEMELRIEGIGGKALPVMTLSPTSPLAMKESRYPITRVGLAELTKTLLRYRRKDLERDAGVHCRRVGEHALAGRRCIRFVVRYDTPAVSPTYRKTIMDIDTEWSIPVAAESFTWREKQEKDAAEEDAASTLIERYVYSDIRFDTELDDSDFELAQHRTADSRVGSR